MSEIVYADTDEVLRIAALEAERWKTLLDRLANS